MPSLQDIATLTSLVIGVGGFLFGLYQWRVNQNDKQPRIKVYLTNSYRIAKTLVPVPPTEAERGKLINAKTVETKVPQVKMEIVNMGHIAVTLTGYFLEGKQRTKFQQLYDTSTGDSYSNSKRSPVIEPYAHNSFQRYIDREQILIDTSEDGTEGIGWIRAIVTIPTGKKF